MALWVSAPEGPAARPEDRARFMAVALRCGKAHARQHFLVRANAAKKKTSPASADISRRPQACAWELTDAANKCDGADFASIIDSRHMFRVAGLC